MLDMGLWGSSELPPLLSPQHFRDTTPRTPDSSSAEMTRGRGRTVTDYQKTEERVSSARGPIIVAAAAAELHGEPPALGTGGGEEGSGGVDKDRQSPGSGVDEESSGQPSPSNVLHTSPSFIPDDTAGATPHRSSLVKRLGSYRRIQPPPQLLQLYQVCIFVLVGPNTLGAHRTLPPSLPYCRLAAFQFYSTAQCSLYCLSQVLSPSLLSRGRAFGSRSALMSNWQQLHAPYFDAPGEWQCLCLHPT